MKIQLGLERITPVATDLGLVDLSASVITVGGTNGKGSCVAALEAVYLNQGFSVGAYTSPHILNYNERIRLNGQDISDQQLQSLENQLDQHPLSRDLSYFERNAVLALMAFKQVELELVILEVGLGGALDATNVVNNDVAIVTTVGFDHCEYLGNDLESIARQKAGIFKPGKYAIYGDASPQNALFEIAAQRNTTLIAADHPIEQAAHIHPQSQACALTCVRLLQNSHPIDMHQAQHTLLHLKVRGRMQWLDTAVPTLVDVAHNPQAAQYLASQISGRVRVVFSALNTKDVSGILLPFKGKVLEWIIAPCDSEMSVSIEEIAHVLQTMNECYQCAESVEKAYAKAVKCADENDTILAFGSFHTVGAVMRQSEHSEKTHTTL